MYVAINEGFFEEEGLSIDLSTGQGADAIKSNLQHMSTLIKRL
jgi:NitT/TauT family transport system substrate-binding protein|nr:ABC transporter substrate-binding protein [uncultured Clostridium sp.]